MNTLEKMPSHLAIILDGNGRWAIKNKFVRTLGHKEGAKRVKEVIQEAFQIGIPFVSIFAFSTENWKRPKEEIAYIFSLPKVFFEDNIHYFLENKIRIIISGDYRKLPTESVQILEKTMEMTKEFSGKILNIALNYGGQDEILKACQEMAVDYKLNKIKLTEFTKENFQKHLYTKDMPPVDFLIRTSNEQRISNFMLWQLSYAEFYFSKVLWPEFTTKQFYKALKEFNKRKRRYGGI